MQLSLESPQATDGKEMLSLWDVEVKLIRDSYPRALGKKLGHQNHMDRFVVIRPKPRFHF